MGKTNFTADFAVRVVAARSGDAKERVVEVAVTVGVIIASLPSASRRKCGVAVD